jgi:hypothetical protein
VSNEERLRGDADEPIRDKRPVIYRAQRTCGPQIPHRVIPSVGDMAHAQRRNRAPARVSNQLNQL